MKYTRQIMGMHITINILDEIVKKENVEEIWKYFELVDSRFSTYKNTSEISKFNEGKIKKEQLSRQMKQIFKLAAETKYETDGYFDIYHGRKIDPSGIVKGWAIKNASDLLKKFGYKNFFIDAGGDIEISGLNCGNKWSIGIRNPFNKKQIVKVIYATNIGIATSGNYERGEHIYNPKTLKMARDIASITVVAPSVFEADKYATAAFAMGEKGIYFIEKKMNTEGYMIMKNGVAKFTSGFEKYLNN